METNSKRVVILRDEPTIIPIASMSLNEYGLAQVMEWVKIHRPECLPDPSSESHQWKQLFPHDRYGEDNRKLTSNELLVEFAGRKCYDSFGLKAGKKSNAEYIKNTQSGEVPHSSILYHAKMSFFFGGISRRVSHEIIRNYVGADRDEEGSPSQESTRFTHHYGFFIEPPKYSHSIGTNNPSHERRMQTHFLRSMQSAYDNYLAAVDAECAEFEQANSKVPTSLDKKRIYEAASSFLPHQAETSFVWTTNPLAISKFIRERADKAADLEIQRFAKKWRRICIEQWPNLFPQPHMQQEM